MTLTFKEVWAWISYICYVNFPSHQKEQENSWLLNLGENQKWEGKLQIGAHWKKKLLGDLLDRLYCCKSNSHTPHNLLGVPEESLVHR